MHIHVCVSVHIKSHVTNPDIEFKAGIVWTRPTGIQGSAAFLYLPQHPALRSFARPLGASWWALGATAAPAATSTLHPAGGGKAALKTVLQLALCQSYKRELRNGDP